MTQTTEKPPAKASQLVSLQDAAIAYARAKARIDAWTGPLRGDLFNRRIARWRAASLEWDAAARRARLERIRSYLQARGKRRAEDAR